ncbi:hypothetical protein X777_14405 [Ooceraea biroi]|uniref:Uncharacterized protein n=1 Tax=Ooceraea biroi TaxID=2015173 RepID=A0A026VZ59_OOCBI|nr:hypothetical protein X777_14405 [Ooceraea biroi]
MPAYRVSIESVTIMILIGVTQKFCIMRVTGEKERSQKYISLKDSLMRLYRRILIICGLFTTLKNISISIDLIVLT